MQWKMAAKGRLAARTHEWAMRRGFPLLVRIAPRLPRWFLHLGARRIIGAMMALYPAPKRAIDRNLERILGEPAGSRRVRRTRRRMIVNLACYWADLFRFCQLPYAETRRVLAATRGRDRLEELLAAGRRVALLTAHLGNWELGAVFLRELEVPVSVVYVPDQSPSAEAFRGFLRSRVDIEQIAIDPAVELSSLPVLRALSAGRAVALQGDRDFNDRGIPFDFFGAPAPFPPGPVLLARLSGAVLLPVFIVYGRRRSLEIEFGDPIEVARTADRAADVHAALGRWVAVLEDAVRRWPDQWYTFFDFWPGAASGHPDEAPPAAAGKEQGGSGAQEGTGGGGCPPAPGEPTAGASAAGARTSSNARRSGGRSA